MTQNIVPKAINFKELVKNSNTTLSLDVQSKMIKLINEEFTESEQQWYIANLYVYMNYHATNDFPINLEHVFKMIGFANKENAKRTLKNNFSKDEDYKTLLVRKDEQKHTYETFLEQKKTEESRGGYNKEQIMLNVDTFKNLCMIAKTEKGKEIRKYYVKLENIYNKIIKEEIEDNKKEIENQKLLLEEKETLIEKQEQKLIKLTRVISHKMGESIYVFECKYFEETIYKIGRTKNANKRESELITGNFNGAIVFHCPCLNSVLLEKLVHQLLDEFRLDANREWFSCSLEKIKETLYYGKFVSEDIIGKDYSNLHEKFKESLHEQTEQTNIPTSINRNIPTGLKNIPKEFILDKNKLLKMRNVNPNDYNLFLQEQCEISEENIVLVSELKVQWKTWSKNGDNSIWQNTLTNLKNKFNIIKMNTNGIGRAKKECFRGLKIKEEFYTFENFVNSNNKIENFLYNKCDRSPFYEISHLNLYNEFEKFQKKIDKDYMFTSVEKELLDNYFDITFLRSKIGSVVKDKDNRIYGWRGVTLKECKQDFNYKILPNKVNGKIVKQINIKGELIRTFNSQREAAIYLKMTPGGLNTAMKKHRLIKDSSDGINYYFNYDV
jgi:phage anti-repressor protein